MKKALLKDSLKQIIKTYKRFISILLMALLGVGFFAGIRSSSPDMKLTIDKYFDDKNVYDIEILSTLGLTEDDISELKKVEGVKNVYGTYSEDVYIRFEDEETVVKVLEFNENINAPNLVEGTLPKEKNECIIDDQMALYKDVKIGDFIQIEEDTSEENDEKNFEEDKLKVVGIAKSPIYISRDKGTTNLGSGKISYIVYVQKDNINSDIFTEAYLIVEGAKELETISDEYDNKIADVKNHVEDIKEERQNSRYESLIKESTEKLDNAQKELDDKKAEAEQKIADAEKEINDSEKKLKNGEKDLKESEKKLNDEKTKANTQFKEAEDKITKGEITIKENEQKINDGKKELESKKKEAEDGINQLNNGIEVINQKITELTENKDVAESVLNSISRIDTTIQNLEQIITQYENLIAGGASNSAELQAQIDIYNENIRNLTNEKNTLLSYGITQDKLNTIINGISECERQKQELINQKESVQAQLSSAEQELTNGQSQIENAKNELEQSKIKLANEKNKASNEFIKAEKEIQKGKNELEDGRKKLNDGKKELEDKKAEFNTKISEAEAKMIDAREKLNDVENAKWYILDRYSNTGFNGYSQDTDNIAKIGDVFPIVFFLIAILISLTTMTRMVEEERGTIGTLKALGYTKMQIMNKYIIYSVLATVIGGIIGISIGLRILPAIVISMYQMMYNFDEVVIAFNLKYSLIGMGTMLVCIVGATVYTANKELSSTPAELMRPKAPKPGKRVLLEKIPFIWNRLTFTRKVTVRNMFRYKKKFLMTIIGICGCTALILTGFGIKDSISKIMDYQYIDIYDYDMMIALKGTLTEEEIKSVQTEFEQNDKIKKCIPIYMNSIKAKSENDEEDIQIVVPNNNEELKEVIRLKDLNTGKILELDSETIIITDKLAQLLNVKIGDKIILKDGDKNEYHAQIGGIAENYIYHYVYMSKDLYNKTFNEDNLPNVLYTQYSKEYSIDEENDISKEILLNSKTASVTLTSKLMESMDDTLSAMNTVVYILIISAGILAFVVLYNLANINISERIRELATIKVLGFYDKEVYNYVTREIVLLTIIGIAIGLIFGTFLNSFILGTCEIGILRFKRIILPQSYLYAILITTIFTIIVNFVTYFSLKKIDMIESLKSVE